MALLFWLLMLNINVELTISNCTVTFDSKHWRKSDAKIINAYNQFLGPIINLTYYDTSVIQSTKLLYLGALRFPGGTVANYWNLSNASYVTPCETDNYNWCEFQQNIDSFPTQTFSASNFFNGISNASLLTLKDSHTIVFDLNMLTLYNQSMIDQLNILKQQINSKYIKYIELGNEYYHNNTYSWQFPNASLYMNKIIPFINAAKKMFPDIKLSVPITTNKNNPWNKELIPYKSYFDAVTIHDYTLTNNTIAKLTENNKMSYISSYGRAMIPQHIEMVLDLYGNKPIWQTEYNMKIENDNISYSTLHAMFIMSYVTSAICNSDNIEFLMLHCLSTQKNNWGKYKNSEQYSLQSNDLQDTTFNIIGQILAHLAWISMIKNNQMFCLKMELSKCPLLDVNIKGYQNLSCVFGAGFNNDTNVNAFGFVIVNSCHMNIDLSIDIKSMANLTENVSLSIWEYTYNQSGKGSRFTDCMKSNEYVWECGAKPNYYNVTVSMALQYLSIHLVPFSMILGNTS
eukprot:473199_1